MSIPSYILVKTTIDLEYTSYVKNKLKINDFDWQGSFASMYVSDTCHLDLFLPQGEGVYYYLFRGKPHYINPVTQNIDMNKGLFSHAKFKYCTRECRLIRKSISDMIGIIK